METWNLLQTAVQRLSLPGSSPDEVHARQKRTSVAEGCQLVLLEADCSNNSDEREGSETHRNTIHVRTTEPVLTAQQA